MSKNLDNFGTFLETLKRRETSRQASRGASFNLLTILVDSGPTPVPDLMKESGMGVADFAEALKTMREAGLITLAGQPGNETVGLTKNGEQVARLTR